MCDRFTRLVGIVQELDLHLGQLIKLPEFGVLKSMGKGEKYVSFEVTQIQLSNLHGTPPMSTPWRQPAVIRPCACGIHEVSLYVTLGGDAIIVRTMN